MSFQVFVFYLLAAVMLFAAIRVITARNPVHSALFLVLAFVSCAGLWLLLEAEFLAIALVLVYVGAVVVLIVFAQMLTRTPTAAASAEMTKNSRPAAVISSLAGLGLAAVFVLTFGGSGFEVRRLGTAENLGSAIFTEWVLAFEVLSVVLLVALIAAIVISRGTERGDH